MMENHFGRDLSTIVILLFCYVESLSLSNTPSLLHNVKSEQVSETQKVENFFPELFHEEEHHLTQEDISYIQSLMREIVGQVSRVKRHTGWHYSTLMGWHYSTSRPGKRPWVRKEIRRLSAQEWKNLVDAMIALKTKGLYDRIAAIHRGLARIEKSHVGPAFFGWHRIYLLILEHALRRERPDVTIPYWDSSLDYDMEDPRTSILWTDKFFGDGSGYVRNGPFGIAWRTNGQGDRLMRNTGFNGTLISKEYVRLVLTRYRHSMIVNHNETDYWLEGYHNGPHVWVDGQMGMLDSAPEDPVFWFHHSFVDYWWQLFINQQISVYGLDPYNDYPNYPGSHGPYRLMDPFNITNRAGYHQYWYRNFYTYQRSPTCSRRHPNCGSLYLNCNLTLERCVSKEDAGLKRKFQRELQFSPSLFFSDSLVSAAGSRAAGRRNAQVTIEEVDRPVLRSGRRFVSTKTDPRTVGNHQRQQSAVNSVFKPT